MPTTVSARKVGLCNAAVYRITVEGYLDAGRAAWFDDLELVASDEHTALVGRVADQAALHGLLARVRDLGLPLLEVCWLADEL